MKSPTETFGKSKLAKASHSAKVATSKVKFQLPSITYNEEDVNLVFKDVGMALFNLCQADLLDKGCIDLDAAWIKTDNAAILALIAETYYPTFENMPEAAIAERKANMARFAAGYAPLFEKLKAEYKSPFMKHKAYYGRVVLKETEQHQLIFDICSTKKKDGTEMEAGRCRIGLNLCQFHAFKWDKTKMTLNEETQEEEYNWLPLSFFIPLEDANRFILTIRALQEARGEMQFIEYGIIISPILEANEKTGYINGELGEFWI